MPQVAKEVDTELKFDEIDIETYRVSGDGRQYVNRTDSAVRMTHRPTGIMVKCQDEQSLAKNRVKAEKHLRAKLYEHFQRQGERFGSGERR